MTPNINGGKVAFARAARMKYGFSDKTTVAVLFVTLAELLVILVTVFVFAIAEVFAVLDIGINSGIESFIPIVFTNGVVKTNEMKKVETNSKLILFAFTICNGRIIENVWLDYKNMLKLYWVIFRPTGKQIEKINT